MQKMNKNLHAHPSQTEKPVQKRHYKYSLERRGILSPTHPTRAVDGADGTARIAIPAPVRHAFGPCVRVCPSRGADRNGWNGHVVW